MERMPETGPGRPLKYPYTVGAKLLQFPWKMHWKKGRGMRFTFYAIVLSMIAVRPINKFGMYNCLLLELEIKIKLIASDLVSMCNIRDYIIRMLYKNCY